MSKDLVNLINNATGNNALPVAIETVTNENGTALMFADGTMICFGEVTYSGKRDTALTSAGGYRTSGASVTFPKAFVSVPLIVGQDTTATNFSISCKLGSATTSGFTITWNGVNSDSNSSTYKASCIAIGRWKN